MRCPSNFLSIFQLYALSIGYPSRGIASTGDEKMPAILTVWILLSFPHAGKSQTQLGEFMGVFATQAACEHSLAAYSDPDYQLPNTKPPRLKCVAEQPQSWKPAENGK
jgi:hypothetical protein